jgi:hypothetical protein
MPGSIIYAKLRRSRELREDSRGDRGQRVYLVKVSDAADGAETAATYDASEGKTVPRVGDPWSEDKPGLVVISRSIAEIEESGIFYEVTCDYGTEDPQSGDNPTAGRDATDPTEREGILTLNFARTDEPINLALAIPTAKDADGADVTIATNPKRLQLDKTIAYSNGEPVDPQLTEVVCDAVVTYRKNLATADFASNWATWKDYVNSVNSQPFTITYRGQDFDFPVDTAWLTDITSASGYENGVAYEEVVLTWQLRDDGWLRNVLDQGYDQLTGPRDDPNLTTKQILNAQGEPTRVPVLLNGKGFTLEPGEKPVFLRFKTKKGRDHRNLPIPEIS